jgi:hypothetical protein
MPSATDCFGVCEGTTREQQVREILNIPHQKMMTASRDAERTPLLGRGEQPLLSTKVSEHAHGKR